MSCSGTITTGFRVVDEQRIDLLIELAHQRRAEPPLIDHRRALANPVGPAQVVEFHRKRPDRHVQDAAAAVPPRADQGGQAGERTHGVTARRIAFDGDAHADHGGLRGGELARERANVIGRDPGDPGDHVRREVRRARRQLVIADRVLLDIIVIDQIFGDDHVDHAERQSGIGAGLDGDVPVGLLGRAGRDRIDHDHLGAAPLRLRDKRPMVQIGADRVDRPEHDVFRINETLRIDRRGRPAGHEKCGDRAGIAECAFRDRGAELVEERVADMEAIENALGPEIAVGKNGARAVFIDDRVPAARNLVESLVPGDPLEFARALGTDAAHRIQHSILAVDPVLVVVDLDAETALGERMIGIAAHLDHLAVTDRGEHGAGIGAIVRTGAEYRGLCHRISPQLFGENDTHRAEGLPARLLLTCATPWSGMEGSDRAERCCSACRAGDRPFPAPRPPNRRGGHSMATKAGQIHVRATPPTRPRKPRHSRSAPSRGLARKRRPSSTRRCSPRPSIYSGSPIV